MVHHPLLFFLQRRRRLSASSFSPAAPPLLFSQSIRLFFLQRRRRFSASWPSLVQRRRRSFATSSLCFITLTQAAFRFEAIFVLPVACMAGRWESAPWRRSAQEDKETQIADQIHEAILMGTPLEERAGAVRARVPVPPPHPPPHHLKMKFLPPPPPRTPSPPPPPPRTPSPPPSQEVSWETGRNTWPAPARSPEGKSKASSVSAVRSWPSRNELREKVCGKGRRPRGDNPSANWHSEYHRLVSRGYEPAAVRQMLGPKPNSQRQWQAKRQKRQEELGEDRKDW